MALILFNIRDQVTVMLHLGRGYLCDAWNYLEMALCSLALAHFTCYIYRFVLVNDLVESLRASYLEEFVDVSFLALWDQVGTSTLDRDWLYLDQRFLQYDMIWIFPL